MDLVKFARIICTIIFIFKVWSHFPSPLLSRLKFESRDRRIGVCHHLACSEQTGNAFFWDNNDQNSQPARIKAEIILERWLFLDPVGAAFPCDGRGNIPMMGPNANMGIFPAQKRKKRGMWIHCGGTVGRAQFSWVTWTLTQVGQHQSFA